MDTNESIEKFKRVMINYGITPFLVAKAEVYPISLATGEAA